MFVRDRLVVLMIKINFHLLQILKKNSNTKKKLQSTGISLVSLHAFMKTLKSDISEAYKVKVDCLKDSESDSYDKKVWKRKWMAWLRCTTQCKKNYKHHNIQNKYKFLPWYLINGLERTVQNTLMSLNTLFELHMKSKK